jgi:uncharacterized protein with HEPN domain
VFLEEIEKGCAKVVRYTDGLSKDDVFRDEVRLDAVLMNLHVIGEVVKKLPADLRERYPEVAWREIAGLRDFIAHAYFALDLDIIWDAIDRDVPPLLDAVRSIIVTEKTGRT